jgi:subtilisin family serine protease
MKQYNVALKEGIDYDGFWNDIESDTDGGKLYIPNRAVEFTNERPASLRQCWYLLTDEEAELLRNDDRVYCVEIPPEFRTDIVMMPRATQTGDFTKTTSDSGAYLNWGLIRSSNATNVYGTGTTTALNYTYTLDGTGVDVVIQDSGLQVDHPEFTDASGNTRVYQIDWGSYSGGAFTQNANHYRDYDGHGTHCAGIACGKTYGWAKEARVYSQKLNGLEGTGDSGTGISITYAFDAIKTWHTSKAGARPTVVNMSWGYGSGYNTVTSLTYRGTSYTDANTTGNSTYRYSTYGLNSSGGTTTTYLANVRIGSVDTDIEEMIAAGIVVCIAAGNRGTKIDVSGGTDYNNFVVTNGGTIYYHRGSSPYSDNALIVGSMDSTPNSAIDDQRATYSETGPGVSIWAPGTDIMSSTSNTNKFTGQSYYLNASFKQCNISGTSMAAPQVAGVAALVLQLNPTYTPSQIRTSLINTAGTRLYTTSLSNDYSNTRSLLGSAIKVLYSNYNATTTTTTTTLAPGQTTTTSTSTTSTSTTTTAAPPDCVQYFCRASNGGYIYWTDCVTGRQNSALLNGGRILHIFSTSYPEKEKGANVSIKMIP